MVRLGEPEASWPPELGNLTSLRFLHMTNNQLSGSIPAELGTLTNLTILELTNNQLSGSTSGIFVT